jgi:hypothetical protein
LLAAAKARAGLRDAFREALLAHGLRRSGRKGSRSVRIPRDLRRASKQRTAGFAFRGSRSRALRERTVKNSCAYAFASSDWTWCITASEFWPSILNEDVARARRVVANRRSEEWNECDCREELGIGNITNIMTKCPYVFSNPNGRLTATAPPPLDRDEKRLSPLAHARHGRHRFGRTSSRRAGNLARWRLKRRLPWRRLSPSRRGTTRR